MRARRSHRGFTLLELLVALAVFGVVSLMAFSGLNTTLDARRNIEQQAERLMQLQKVFNRMRDDFEQAVARPVRDHLGQPNPKSAFVQVEQGVLFTRGGRPNPLGLPRSSLERVGWGIKEDKLVRVRFQNLDEGVEPIFTESEMLDGVRILGFRFLTMESGEAQWLEQWPPLNSANPGPELPRAVEVNLELDDFGVITRIFVLPF